MEKIDSATCNHPAFEPERYMGTLTSRYVCVRCGLSVSCEHAMYLAEAAKAKTAKTQSVVEPGLGRSQYPSASPTTITVKSERLGLRLRIW